MRSPKLALLVVALAFILAGYLWHPLHNAWWYVTDDYRWPTLVGADGNMTLSEFFRNCNPPDFPLGSKVNRPTYYFSTAVMMYVLGDNYHLWYFARIGIMAVSLASIGYVLTRVCGVIPALVAVILIGIHGLWTEALLRLQSELFSFLGFAFVILLSFAVYSPQFEKLSRKARWLLLIFLTLAALYLTGSKENITVLMLGLSSGMLLWSLFSNRAEIRRFLVPSAFTLLWGSIIAYQVYRGVLITGSDLYGNKLSADLAVGFFVRSILSNYWGLTALAATSLSATALLLQKRFNHSDQNKLGLLLVIGAQVGVIGYGGFLMYFYRGSIPPNSRYEFPFVFVPLAGLLLFTAWAVGLKATRLNRLSLTFLATGLVIAYGAISFSQSNYNYNLTMAKSYSTATHDFQQRLEMLFKLARKDGSRPILFKSHGLVDTEPLISVELFLHANAVFNPIYLEIVGYSEQTLNSPSELHLYRLTTGLITSGRFKEKAALPDSVEPIVANFSNPDLSNGAIANFWPVW